MRTFIAAMLLIGSGWPVVALAQEVETRRYEGQGSRGVGSDIEFFVVGGNYRHTLEGSDRCIVNASVFPGPRRPSAALSEVIDADLGIPDDVAADSFSITQQGWVNLQVGTGPDCTWDYTVTGVFLRLGDEPEPPGSRLVGWWPVVLVAAGVVVLIGTGVLRRSQREVEEPKVQVSEPPE